MRRKYCHYKFLLASQFSLTLHLYELCFRAVHTTTYLYVRNNKIILINYLLLIKIIDTLRTKTFGTEKLSDFFLSEKFSVRNLGLPKVFPSENFRFSAILLKSPKTFKNIVGLNKTTTTKKYI